MYLEPFCGVREFVNKSAASAASPDYVKFQAKSKKPTSRGAPEAVIRQRGPRPGAPLGLGFLDLAFGEAALAADLIAA